MCKTDRARGFLGMPDPRKKRNRVRRDTGLPRLAPLTREEDRRAEERLVDVIVGMIRLAQERGIVDRLGSDPEDEPAPDPPQLDLFGEDVIVVEVGE